MLKNKVALMTRASRGIGKAIAILLAKQGAKVIINYNGSKENAEETKREIEAEDGVAECYQCSVSDPSACMNMIEYIIKNYGRLDILVNNAGITKDNLLLKMTPEDFDLLIDTNLKGTFYTMKYSTKQFLKQRNGRIINISSITGLVGNAGQINYAASKAGIVGMTKSIAKELASRGITANVVAPGYIDTDMTQGMREEVKEAILDQIPLKRVGNPNDIAQAVLFLASENASYITGQVLSVDGGMHM